MNISPTTLPQLASALSLQPEIGNMPFQPIFEDCATVPTSVEDMSPYPQITIQCVAAPNTENDPVQAGTRINSIQPTASRIHHQDLKNIEHSTPELATFLDWLVKLSADSGASAETAQQRDASPPLPNLDTAVHSPSRSITNAVSTPLAYSQKVELPPEPKPKISESIIAPLALPQPTRIARLPYSIRENAPETFGSAAMEADATTTTIASSFQLPMPATALPNKVEVLRQPEPPTLDLFKDAQWLETLARDITASAARDGKLQFRLVPDFLGALDIGLAHENGSVDVHVETTTDAAAQIIAVEQPRLLEELRHSGLKLGSFDLNGGQQGGTQRQQQPAVPAAVQHPTKDQTPPKRDGRFA